MNRGLLTLAAGAARLRLAPAVGGAIADWHVGETQVMRPAQPGALAENNPRGLASYPLVPLSNRVAGRRFSFAGLTYPLPDLLDGLYIHGAGWMLPWTVQESGPAHATLQLDYPGGPLWPFAFVAEQRLLLLPDGLRHEISVRNTAEHAAPLALGSHPFFPRTPQARLHFAAHHVWLHDAARIPTRRVDVPPQWDHRHGLTVGRVTLDHCFAAWNGLARIVWPEHELALSIAADPVFRHAIVYIPDGQDFFAFEPVSNMTDGINRIDGTTEHGMAILRPGEQIAGTIRFTLEHTA
ncbi:MAG: aldose 1-epimerase [Acetobacteraceae bacterium]|nr:aldose 1-epimerase [Acetobacteraceae bacterium]